MNLYAQLEVMRQKGTLQSRPIFSSAAKCVALEQPKPSLGALKRYLKCWLEVIKETATASGESTIRLKDGSSAPLSFYWKAKRLELLRDQTVLSSIAGMWYNAWRLGLLTAENVDKHAQRVQAGLLDPALLCQAHYLQGFDEREQVVRRSAWKRHAELLLALNALKASKREEAFSTAAALADNRQQWRSVQAVHAQLPGLRAAAFWKKEDFPWLLELEERFAEVQAELLRAVQLAGLAANPDDVLPERSPDDWRSLAFLLDGRWNENACRDLAPVTCGLLRNRPELDVRRAQLPQDIRREAAERGFQVKGPVAMVKIYLLQPGAFLRPHFGSHGRLAAHLGLKVPKGCCSLTVGGEVAVWEEGKVMVFDDSFAHEARNSGTQPRMVLGIFFVHPDLLRHGASEEL